MSEQTAGPFDPRVYFFLMIASAVSSLVVHVQISLAALFAVALIWRFLSKNASDVLFYVFFYLVLEGASYLGYLWVTASPEATLGLAMTHFSMAGRKALIPLLFAFTLAKEPSGSLIASFNAMKLPKPFGISVAIMLRFFPTLGEEYRSIRNAQKFRGVGVGFWNTIAHVPQVLNYVLIPLTIRITRISEELSASVTVRGVRFSNEIVSFRPIRFSAKDGIALTLSVLVLSTIVVLDQYEVLL